MKYYLIHDTQDLDYVIVREDQHRTRFSDSLTTLLTSLSHSTKFHSPKALHQYFTIDIDTDLITPVTPHSEFELLAIFDQIPVDKIVQTHYPELLL